MMAKKQTWLRLLAAALVFLFGMSLFRDGSSSLQSEKGRTGEQKMASVSRSGFLLNTFVTVTLYETDDEALLDRLMELCAHYETVFSRTMETSELYQINHRDPKTASMTVSDDMAALLKKGLEYCALSDGAFDITIEPVSSLWDFSDRDGTVPDKDEIKERASRVDYRSLRLSGNTLSFLSPDVSIDLGAIAKGYIADRMKEAAIEAGVRHAIINLGGNVLCIGGRPDQTPFQIGLKKPFSDREEIFDTVLVDGMSVVTSGIYERYFVVDGVHYHHLLNPKTGYPYQNGLISVTILSDRSVDGDGLSTTCFSLGLEKGMELIRSLDGVYACFLDDTYQVHYSEGMEQFRRKP